MLDVHLSTMWIVCMRDAVDIAATVVVMSIVKWIVGRSICESPS